VSGSFEDYVAGGGQRLLRFGYVLTGDRQLSEDLVQEALAKAHRRWPRIGSLDHPDAYVRRMIVNSFISWRRRTRRVSVVADPPEPDPSRTDGGDHGVQYAERDAMWRLLAELPKQQRAVLVLRFYEGLPDDEIAHLVQCSAVTVRAHASKGLARLRASDTTLSILNGAN
jgi:RNA polymerase sigma-70 factor (sigma-E family)